VAKKRSVLYVLCEKHTKGKIKSRILSVEKGNIRRDNNFVCENHSTFSNPEKSLPDFSYLRNSKKVGEKLHGIVKMLL
jgi:hypothetical protein